MKNNISTIKCRKHDVFYLKNSDGFICPFGCSGDDRWYLVKTECGGQGWSEWNYVWQSEFEVKPTDEVIISVSKKIYQLIQHEND